jgi:two-component system sensor histidine kinase BaeS
MRSLTTRFFAALVLVSIAALVLGTWWVRRAVELEVGSQLIVEQTIENIDGQEVIRETRREIGPNGQVIDEQLRGPIDVGELNRRLLMALTVVVFGAAIVTALVARRVLTPIKDLRSAVDQMAAGRSEVRVAVRGNDELASLGRAFNAMADTVATQKQLRRELTNDIAHELRTPLTDLRCHLEALQDQVVPVTSETLDTLHAEVAHLQRLVDDLGELARAETRQLPLTPELVVVAEVVESLVKHAGPRAAGLGVRVQCGEIDPAATAWIDPGRFRQVVANLIDNALVHTPSGGGVVVTATTTGGHTRLAVRDTGPGIPPEHLPHIFDRFYRVDPSRSRSTGGVGLGLAIAKQFVDASGGSIQVDSEPGQGATFLVVLPSAPAAS